LDREIASDGERLGKYLEKVFEPLGKLVFPVGLVGSDEREAFGAVNYDVFYAVRLDTKKGKMFLEMACQVLLRRRLNHGVTEQPWRFAEAVAPDGHGWG
jgi:hypothetical protein